MNLLSLEVLTMHFIEYNTKKKPQATNKSPAAREGI